MPAALALVLVLVTFAACKKSDEPAPSPEQAKQQTCEDACVHMLWTVEQAEHTSGVIQDLTPACTEHCTAGEVDTTCMYTARTTKDAIRCLEKGGALK